MKNGMIGILSGSGPEAGLDLVKEMHIYLQNQYGAIDDSDYPPYILYNRPLEAFGVTGILDYDVVRSDFLMALDELNQMGVDYIVIACNTLHILLKDIPLDIRKKIVSIVDVAVERVVDDSSVLLLSSSSTRDLCLYDGALANKHNTQIIKVADHEQSMIDDGIEAAMAGRIDTNHKEGLLRMIDQYIQSHGVDVVILGCTEIPLLIDAKDIDIVCVNTTRELAKKIVDIVKQ